MKVFKQPNNEGDAQPPAGKPVPMPTRNSPVLDDSEHLKRRR